MFSFNFGLHSQIANYVSNGSFEDATPITIPPVARYWSAPDSTKIGGELLSSVLNPFKVPLNGYGYQWPKHGNNYIVALQYCPDCGNKRTYPKNRLKGTLKAGKMYCVKFYINLANQATHGIDAIGAYFSNNIIDTITRSYDPITYLTPQVQNPVNNIITDTLNWIPITGTFVANGSEKYMTIGNFKTDSNTHKILVNPANLPLEFSDYFIDDVSCIELNLPAYAGSDKSIAPGDSAYLGRELDFAIDSGCTWYQLPNLSTPIKIASGLWVKPTITSTYVVKQVLDCSPEKWDTVVVYMNLVGSVDLNEVEEGVLNLFPNPANNFIEIRFSNTSIVKDFSSIFVYNNLGQLIKEENLIFKDNSFNIKTNDLPEGVYYIQLKRNNSGIISKRFVINR